ncbi:sugar transporter membrane protein [Gracilibacillus boraciitolerans JCM 21714]|uniref:Sugar transporter membrane protein n=1 Tax=Gracilibacillus boraciitolerans JCM 21714 TaxID=1298598 RepID=W4VNM3_9BACI|nr:carbohydrate ABC transporter permease [Gracilibacillus boraciitolerans]GAE94374.1 sugar transporter membrane protein [Gracilibacillus boraciitolerans JCM 21714]
MATSSIFHNIRTWLSNRWYWVPLFVLLIWTITPLVWAVSASFKDAMEVYQTPVTLIPNHFNLDNYIRVFEYPNFWRYLFNSVFLAITTTIIAVVISILAGYAFARYAFRFRHILLIIILVPRIIPRASIIVPLFTGIAALGMLDSYLSLILTYTATAIPLATWILAGFFKVIPKALEEAAQIDGAKPWQIIWYVVIPISLPAIITVSIFSLREAWNEFPFVLAFTSSQEMRTLPYQLFMLKDSMGMQDWPMVLAFTIVTILPLLILYIIFENAL